MQTVADADPQKFFGSPDFGGRRQFVDTGLTPSVTLSVLSVSQFFTETPLGLRFGVAVTRWSRSTQLLYIEPG